LSKKNCVSVIYKVSNIVAGCLAEWHLVPLR